MASTSPEMAQVMAFIQQHNGDPMAALNDIARQKGVTPDYAMNKVKGML